MGPSGHAPAFIFAVFDTVNGSMRVSRALICSRMLVTKIYTSHENIHKDLFHMSKKTEISAKKPGENQAPYLK